MPDIVIEEIRRINEDTLSESCSKEKIKEIKEIIDSPHLCPHEDYSKEVKRFFDQRKERLANLQNQESNDQEDSSFEGDDPNTGKFHKRIYEKLQANFFRPNLQPTFLNTARRDLESKKPYNAENYGWLMVLGKAPLCFDYQKSFSRNIQRHSNKSTD